MARSVFDPVIGQRDTIDLLRSAAGAPTHAYLFLGPAGATKHEAARAFAAVLIGGTEDPEGRDSRLALASEHPDIREVERVGASISAEQAREIVRLAALAPVESSRKVLILHEFQLVRPEAAAILLKTLEEPPPSTTFVILAEFITSELITIASRCTRVEFHAIDTQQIADQLVMEGVDPDSALEAAEASGGNLVRARVLASDPDLALRRRAFATAPSTLDGTGATVMRLSDELLSLAEAATAPLAARHAEEVAAVNARIAQFGERGSGAKALEERHKRETRRYRVDALRDGLAQMAATYRDAMLTGTMARPTAAAEAVTRIHEAIAALDRNPNEALLMQSLLWALPPVTGRN